VSAAVVIGVGLLGGVGALGRYWLDAAVSARSGGHFPFGTLAVNLTGAFALGVLSGAVLGTDALRLAGTGLLGAYTTFSTWVLESHRLGEDGEARHGIANMLTSLVLGLGVAWAGSRLGARL
jgi:CrcB protein